MAPWSTRRLTFLLLVVLVLSMVAPPVSRGVAEDIATPGVTPDIVAEPTETAAPPPEPAPAPTAVPTQEPAPVAPTETPAPTATVEPPVLVEPQSTEEPVPTDPVEPPTVPTGAGILAVDPSPTATAEPTATNETPSEPQASLTVIVLAAGNQEPIPGAWVVVSDMEGFVVTSSAANEDGVFTTGPIAEGEYRVEFSADGYSPQTWGFWISGVVEQTIYLNPVLLPGDLTILVLDSGTKGPIEGASVTVYGADPGVTGGDGRFVVAGLPGGSYYVEISADGYHGTSGWVEVSGAVEHTFVLEPLPKAGVLTVTVIDAVTGEPIAGAFVVLYGVESGTTDGQGVYVFGELGGGNYYGEVSAKGYLSQYLDPFVNGPTFITLELQPLMAGTLTVEVVNRTSGEPVAGASVAVYEYWGHVFVAEGTTGEGGLVTFGPLPGGDYAIEVTHPSYYDGFASTFLNGDASTLVNLEPLPLPGALTITVIDEDTQQGIAGATVLVTDTSNEVVAQGLTNESGVYVTSELAGGHTWISIEAQGYVNGYLYHWLDGPATIDSSLRPLGSGMLSVQVTDQSTGMGVSGAVVVVTDGYSNAEVASGTADDMGVAIFDLPGGFYRVVASAAGYYQGEGVVQIDGAGNVYLALEPRVAGDITMYVVDAVTWQPIAGVPVTIVDVDSGHEVASGVTDEGGMVSVGTLAGGYYDAVVEADGYVTTTTRFQVNGSGTMTLYMERQPGVLTLYVTDEVTGEPISGATVVLNGQFGAPRVEGVTDADGVYVSDQLPGNVYHLEVAAAGYLYATIDVDIKGDVTVELPMEPTAPGVLTLTVLDEETGAPIRGAMVRVLSAYDSAEIDAGTSDRDGRFVTDTLESGYYWLEVTADGYDNGRSFPFVNGPTERTISLRPQLPGTLTIRVIDALADEPVAKASVVVYEVNGDISTSGKTKNSGEFRTGDLPEGEYIIEILASGYYPERSWAWVHGDTEQLVSLTPRIEGSLTVTVVDADTETPITGATVSVFSFTGAEVASGVTDDSGIFVSSVLESGNHLVNVTAEGYLWSGTLYPWVNGDTALEVSLEAAIPGTLSVQVFASGTYEWLPGASVVVREEVSGQEVARGVTDEFGTYTTLELPGGDYVVRAAASGYTSYTQHVRFNGHATTTIFLGPGEAHTPGAVVLQVISVPSGEPIAGASVSFINPDDLSIVATGMTDATGAFLSAEMPAGEYSVSVMADFYIGQTMTVTVDGPTEVTAMMEMQRTASLQVVPLFVEPGDHVTVTGEGFLTSERVHITWNMPGGELLAEVKVTKDGTFSRHVAIPGDATGYGAVVAVGMDSGAFSLRYVVVGQPGGPGLTP